MFSSGIVVTGQECGHSCLASIGLSKYSCWHLDRKLKVSENKYVHKYTNFVQCEKWGTADFGNIILRRKC
jgi:hypothetical protein